MPFITLISLILFNCPTSLAADFTRGGEVGKPYGWRITDGQVEIEFAEDIVSLPDLVIGANKLAMTRAEIEPLVSNLNFPPLLAPSERHPHLPEVIHWYGGGTWARFPKIETIKNQNFVVTGFRISRPQMERLEDNGRSRSIIHSVFFGSSEDFSFTLKYTKEDQGFHPGQTEGRLMVYHRLSGQLVEARVLGTVFEAFESYPISDEQEELARSRYQYLWASSGSCHQAFSED